MTNEPARIIAVLTAFVTAVIGLVAAFGLGLDEGQRNAIIGVIAPTVTLIVVAGELIRSRVVSPNTAATAVLKAKEIEPGSDDVPDIPVKGYRRAVSEVTGVSESGFNWTGPL